MAECAEFPPSVRNGYPYVRRVFRALADADRALSVAELAARTEHAESTAANAAYALSGREIAAVGRTADGTVTFKLSKRFAKEYCNSTPG